MTGGASKPSPLRVLTCFLAARPWQTRRPRLGYPCPLLASWQPTRPILGAPVGRYSVLRQVPTYLPFYLPLQLAWRSAAFLLASIIIVFLKFPFAQ